ncbi:MAG: hypothetical protein ACOY3I_02480 [Verrucomicrobiota bacterium]
MDANMIFGGGGGKGPMSKTDLRVVAVVFGLCLSIFLAWYADQGVFKAEPKSHFQAILAYVAVLGSLIADGDRVVTFAFSTVIFFTIIAVVGFVAFYFFEVYVIEPLVIKRKMMYVKREKALMNKFDDGTL